MDVAAEVEVDHNPIVDLGPFPEQLRSMQKAQADLNKAQDALKETAQATVMECQEALRFQNEQLLKVDRAKDRTRLTAIFRDLPDRRFYIYWVDQRFLRKKPDGVIRPPIKTHIKKGRESDRYPVTTLRRYMKGWEDEIVCEFEDRFQDLRAQSKAAAEANRRLEIFIRVLTEPPSVRQQKALEKDA